MRTYLYTGAKKRKAVCRLAMSVAGLQLPTYVASFGPPGERHPLAPYTGILPIDLVRVRLPGRGLPRCHTPADQIAVKAVLAVFRQVIHSGNYHLVILDGVREAMEEGLLDVADLQHLIAHSPDSAEIAMT